MEFVSAYQLVNSDLYSFICHVFLQKSLEYAIYDHVRVVKTQAVSIVYADDFLAPVLTLDLVAVSLEGREEVVRL